MKKKKRNFTISDIPENPPELSEEIQAMTMYIAMAVRNAMEDFHVKHLSDAQMKELNIIIRNAIATALYAHQNIQHNPLAQHYVNFQCKMIPDYWEKPVLIQEFSREGFLKSLEDDLMKWNDVRPEGAEPITLEGLADSIMNGIDRF